MMALLVYVGEEGVVHTCIALYITCTDHTKKAAAVYSFVTSLKTTSLLADVPANVPSLFR